MINVGFKFDLTNDQYHTNSKYDFLSSSGLRQFLKSPAHYKEYKDNPTAPTKEMIFGSAAHVAVLEPHKYDDLVAVRKKVDGRTNEGKEYKADFELQSIGKLIVDEEQAEHIEGMKTALKQYEVASSLINSPNSKKEVSGVWIDAFGVACKLRADILNITDRIIVDYKTTKDASKRAFKRDIFYRGYDIQAAMYLDGVKKILDTDRFINFLWIAQEKTPPYGVAVYRADTEVIEHAFDKINKCKPLFKECVKNDKWQGYEDKVQNIMPYGWS